VGLFVYLLLLLGGLLFSLAGCLRKEDARVLYVQRCLGCHGPSGMGAVAVFLPLAVPDCRDTVKRQRVIQIRQATRRGVGVVPAFEPAGRKYAIQDLVRMVRNLSMVCQTLEWRERFEPLTWAHYSVSWQYVFDAGLREEDKT